MTFFEKHVFVCENSREASDPRGCCASRGATEFTSALKSLCKNSTFKNKVRVNKAGCLDFCSQGAVAVVYPDAIWYRGLTAADATEIFESHIKNGIPVERLRITSRTPS